MKSLLHWNIYYCKPRFDIWHQWKLNSLLCFDTKWRSPHKACINAWNGLKITFHIFWLQFQMMDINDTYLDRLLIKPNQKWFIFIAAKCNIIWLGLYLLFCRIAFRKSFEDKAIVNSEIDYEKFMFDRHNFLVLYLIFLKG